MANPKGQVTPAPVSGAEPARVIVLNYGPRSIRVRLSRGAGDRLRITVHPDQSVTAVAPQSASEEAILRRLQARAGWIHHQIEFFERFKPLPPPRRYVSGETVSYLGRQYRLKVRTGEPPSARLVGRYLRIDCPTGSAEEVRPLVEDWFRGRARQVFADRLAACAGRTKALSSAEPRLLIRRMRARWGSCTRAGRITLNPDLVMVPSACIDYVIVHELCHLRVLGHGPAFYALLTRHMPDWRRRKERLDRYALPAT